MELARIVSGRSSPASSRRRPALSGEPSAKAESDLARDLEAELLSDLHASFGAAGEEEGNEPAVDPAFARDPYYGGQYPDDLQPAEEPTADPDPDESLTGYDDRSGYQPESGYADAEFGSGDYGSPADVEPDAGQGETDAGYFDESPAPEPEPRRARGEVAFGYFGLRRNRPAGTRTEPTHSPVRPISPRPGLLAGLPPADLPEGPLTRDLAGQPPEWDAEHAQEPTNGWAADGYGEAGPRLRVSDSPYRLAAAHPLGETDYPAGYGYASEADAGGRRGLRRGQIYGVAAVLAVVVIGTVAALSLSGGDGETTPPVITADAAPARIVPEEPAATDVSPGAAVFDQIDPDASPPAAETVLPGADEPLADVAGSEADGGAGDEIAALTSANTDATEEAVEAVGPRMVRTTTIRPDGSIVSNEAAPADGDDPSAGEGTADTAVDEVIAAPPATPDESTLLAPGTEATEIVSPPAEVAAAPPVETIESAADLPAGEATLTATPPAGFYVQVASVGSESEALAQFAALQARAPSLLGGEPAIIQRADLGTRGVYYRIQVGPMSQSEADTLRANLRAANVVPDAIIAEH